MIGTRLFCVGPLLISSGHLTCVCRGGEREPLSASAFCSNHLTLVPVSCLIMEDARQSSSDFPSCNRRRRRHHRRRLLC